MQAIESFGDYAVTEEGQVWSYRLDRFLKRMRKRVHILVAQAYIPNPESVDTTFWKRSKPKKLETV